MPCVQEPLAALIFVDAGGAVQRRYEHILGLFCIGALIEVTEQFLHVGAPLLRDQKHYVLNSHCFIQLEPLSPPGDSHYVT